MRIGKPHLNQIETSYRAYKAQIETQLENLKNGKVRKAEENKDSIEISPKAKELFEQTVAGQKEAETSPSFVSREQLVDALTKSRLALNNSQAERITDRVMKEVTQEEAQQAEKIATIRQRVESGYYNSPEVFEKIAEGLMKEMNF